MRPFSARTLTEPRQGDDDDGRIGALAAGLTLGGHALVLFAVLLLGGRQVETVAVQNAVSVTLVGGGAQGSGGKTGAADPPARPSRPATSSTAPASTPAKAEREASGESLDQLLAPAAKPSPAAPAAGALAKANAPTPSSPSTGGTGSSRAGQGLGPGEGAEGVDLYAAASLPDVGARPASPPAGDLWKKVAPCWRPAAPRPATLLVDLDAAGRLAAAPRAVRKITAPADPQLLLAERAAARALQACAPYEGLGGRTWRVGFP